MNDQANHSFSLEMRLHEARSLLIAVNSEETILELKADRLMACLSGIDRLIEDAEQDHTRMICEIRGDEVMA